MWRVYSDTALQECCNKHLVHTTTHSQNYHFFHCEKTIFIYPVKITKKSVYPVLKKIQRLLSLFRLDSSVLDFSRRQLSAIHNICPHSLEWLLKVIAGHCQLLPEGERGRGRRDFDQSDSLSSLEWRTN